jgi:prepilin-type N-terminal cleavage/methylation domain-containing protein
MYGGSIMNTTNKKAFTLIEMLVVVVIIGILAAIALPQYQKAVEKALVSEAFIIQKNILQASELYILQHGKNPDTLEDLDITIPGTRNVPNHRNDTKYFAYRLFSFFRLPWDEKYAVYFFRNEQGKVTTHVCCWRNDNDYEYICNHIGMTKPSTYKNGVWQNCRE